MIAWAVTLACAGTAALLLLLGVVQVVFRRREHGTGEVTLALLVPPRVRCMANAGYEASLIVGRVYRRAPRETADPAPAEMLRVIDDSGEDYLYPAEMFRPTWRWR